MSEGVVVSIYTFPNVYGLNLIPPDTTMIGPNYRELLKEK